MTPPARFLILAALLLPLPALAQSGPDQPAQPESQSSAPAGEADPLRFGNDEVFLELAPFVQIEGGWADSSPEDFLVDRDRRNGDFRRARLYAEFGYYDLGGLLTVDFETIEDAPIVYAYINYALTDRLTVQAGQQDVPFSLQDLTGSRSASFAEDGQNSALQPGDYVGVAALYGAENYSLAAGVFGGDINDDKPFDDRGLTVSGRATYAPIAEDDRAVHLGAALLGTFDPGEPLSFSGDFGTNLVPTSTISTGDFEDADSYLSANLELAATNGRFTFQSEYTLSEVDDADRGSAFLHGGYAAALLFLTRDHRGYDPSSGTFERVKPARAIGDGGVGAVEIGARLDYLDLRDAGEDSGAKIAATGILNWYPTSRLRFSGSHTYTQLTEGPDQGADLNSTLFRAAFIY